MNTTPKKIYLDYASTTPVDSRVIIKMLPYFDKEFGNPMSIHGWGEETQKAVEHAREQISAFLHCTPGEIVFTSGATESCNLAIKGAVHAHYSNPLNKKVKPHIVTTAFEHHCVLDTCLALQKRGMVDITLVSPNREGIISPGHIKKAITPNTILVSVMYVNNEIGTIQPITEIGNTLRAIKSSKQAAYPIFHTDATQAINYLDCNVDALGVDLLSISGHKIYGPKGIGALYVRERTPLAKIQDGGSQESGLRAGTHNVPGIAGLGKAIEIANRSQKTSVKKAQILRDYLIKKVLDDIPGSHLNGSYAHRIPNNANFRIDNIEGEALLLALSLEGIAISTGSACSSKTLEPSHVLRAIGLTHEQAHGSLRITLGKYTTKKEINAFVNALERIVDNLRKVSGKLLSEYKRNAKYKSSISKSVHAH